MGRVNTFISPRPGQKVLLSGIPWGEKGKKSLQDLRPLPLGAARQVPLDNQEKMRGFLLRPEPEESGFQGPSLTRAADNVLKTGSLQESVFTEQQNARHLPHSASQMLAAGGQSPEHSSWVGLPDKVQDAQFTELQISKKNASLV